MVEATIPYSFVTGTKDELREEVCANEAYRQILLGIAANGGLESLAMTADQERTFFQELFNSVKKGFYRG